MRGMLNIMISTIVKNAHISRDVVLNAVSLAFFVVLIPIAAHAVTSISQGYSTSEALPIGSIVSLQKDTSDRVVASTNANVDSILGVVINDGSSLLTLSNGQGSQVQIATNGVVPALVSDINGAIVQGDQITASPIKGVGMKATSNTKVVGIAQGTPTSDTAKQKYTDQQGKEQSVSLGQVPVLVSVSYFSEKPEKTIIPQSLQNVANSLAGKEVSSLPIIISAAIFIVTLAIVVIIIYSMIRSSIISVGRNPMAQSAVYRDVIQLSALILVILGVSIIAIYIILTRL